MATKQQQAKTTVSTKPSGNPLSGTIATSNSAALPPAETALMRAVLDDAIMCYLGRGRRRRIDPRILAREAEHWIRSEDWESPFSFNNVCSVLGLAPDSTRPRILSWTDSPESQSSVSMTTD